MKFFSGLALTLLAGTAMATDYTVGIVSHDINNYGVVTGTALNLYSITSGGVTLVPGSPYVWDKKDPMGNSYLPAIVEMDPAHGFVYVEYVATTLPYIVGFKVTAQGLVQQWAVEAEDAGNNFVNWMAAGPGYVIVYSTPAGLWAEVINQAGQQVFSDGSGETDSLVALRLAPDNRFYYSCRDISVVRTVLVYSTQPADLGSATLVATSTDKAFFQGVCHNLRN
jgi:hypothetical protein